MGSVRFPDFGMSVPNSRKNKLPRVKLISIPDGGLRTKCCFLDRRVGVKSCRYWVVWVLFVVHHGQFSATMEPQCMQFYVCPSVDRACTFGKHCSDLRFARFLVVTAACCVPFIPSFFRDPFFVFPIFNFVG